MCVLCVCVCVRALRAWRARALRACCVCVNALRIVSTDKILCFMKTLIITINVVILSFSPLLNSHNAYCFGFSSWIRQVEMPEMCLWVCIDCFPFGLPLGVLCQFRTVY